MFYIAVTIDKSGYHVQCIGRHKIFVNYLEAKEYIDYLFHASSKMLAINDSKKLPNFLQPPDSDINL